MTRGPRAGAEDASIGLRIRVRRRQKRVSLEALAAQVGVSKSQLSRYERGEDRVAGSRLLSLARALDVRPSFLLGERP
jgi:transcriptional regulator with XRE-family HTH domain